MMVGLTLDEYQDRASMTAVYPNRGSTRGFIYTALGCAGEGGEIAEHAKKLLRDDDGVMSNERRNKVFAELGDALWYISQAAYELGVTLEDVAQYNLAKLARRQEQDLLHGEGSAR